MNGVNQPLSGPQVDQFRETVYAFYDQSGRHELVWRQPTADGNFDPYWIMVSEIMLQQTQVSRVTPKFQEFVARFPDVRQLAVAPQGAVLTAWSGLGYNRRAKFLHQAAQVIVNQFGGTFPDSVEALVSLPGIGRNTAGAILAYASNQPIVFIETNIRTVFIHHFFKDDSAVADNAIGALVAQTLDDENPRQWYWALMDYGAHLKRTFGNLSRSSSSYHKQSAFHGSRRQIRGRVIHRLSEAPLDLRALQHEIGDPRLESVLAELVAESLIQHEVGKYSL